ncbi:hypothetical protein ABZ848_27360 [Streptomyces sp. NPDC047081]
MPCSTPVTRPGLPGGTLDEILAHVTTGPTHDGIAVLAARPRIL